MFRAWMRHQHWVIWFTRRRRFHSGSGGDRLPQRPRIFLSEKPGLEGIVSGHHVEVAHGIVNEATTVMIRARAVITMIAHSVTQIANGMCLISSHRAISSGVTHCVPYITSAPQRESVHRGSTCALIWSAPMTLAEVYKHNASECRRPPDEPTNAVDPSHVAKNGPVQRWQDAEALRASTLRDGKARRLTSAVKTTSIELIDAAEKVFPRSFMKPRAASWAEISRSESCPPLGRRRRS